MRLDEEEVLIRDDSGLLHDADSSSYPVRQNGWWKKLRRTMSLSMAFFALGLCFAIPGPTLLDLGDRVQASVAQMMMMFAARSVGYLLGAILGGVLFDCFDKQLLLFCTLLISSVATVAIPWCLTLVVMATMFGLQGITMGVLDTGGNVFCIRLWGKRSGPYIQTLHFAFGIGAFIAPLLATPFLSDQMVTYNNSLLQGNIPVSPYLLDTINHNRSTREDHISWNEQEPFYRNLLYIKDIHEGNSLDGYRVKRSDDSLPDSIPGLEVTKSTTSTFRTTSNGAISGAGLQSLDFQNKDEASPDKDAAAGVISETIAKDDNGLGNIDVEADNTNKVRDNSTTGQSIKPLQTDNGPPTPTNVSSTTPSSIVTSADLTVDNLDTLVSTNVSGSSPVKSSSTVQADIYVSGTSTVKSPSTVQADTNAPLVVPIKKPSAATDADLKSDFTDGEKVRPHLDDHKDEPESGPPESENITVSTVTPTSAGNTSSNSPTTSITDSKRTENGTEVNGKSTSVSSSTLSTLSSTNSPMTVNTSSSTTRQDIVPSSTTSDALVNTGRVDNAPTVALPLPDTTSVGITSPPTTPAKQTTTTAKPTTTTAKQTTSTAKPTTTTAKPTTTTAKPTTTTAKQRTAEPTTTTTSKPSTTTTTAKPTTTEMKTSTESMSSSTTTSTSTTTESIPSQTTQQETSSSPPESPPTSSVDHSSTHMVNVSGSGTGTSLETTVVPTKPTTTKDSFLNNAIQVIKNISRIQFAYLIIGLVLFINAVIFLVLYCKDKGRLSSPMEVDDFLAARNVGNCTRSAISVLMGLFLLCYMGLEVTYGALVTSFVVDSMHWPKPEGATVAAIFWGSLAAGRGFSIFIARCCGPVVMLSIDLVLMVIGGLVLSIGLYFYSKLIWLGTLVLGLGMSSVFPAGLSWAENYIHLTGKTTAIFTLGSGIGQIVFPTVTGYFFEHTEKHFLMQITAGSSVFLLILFIVIQCFASRSSQKLYVQDRNGFLPLEDAEEDNMELDLIHFDKSERTRRRDRRARGETEYKTLISDLDDD